MTPPNPIPVEASVEEAVAEAILDASKGDISRGDAEQAARISCEMLAREPDYEAGAREFEEWAREHFKREIRWDVKGPYLVHDAARDTRDIWGQWEGWQAAASLRRVDYAAATRVYGATLYEHTQLGKGDAVVSALHDLCVAVFNVAANSFDNENPRGRTRVVRAFAWDALIVAYKTAYPIRDQARAPKPRP